MRAPRVLLSGVALAQPMGGVVRHNLELLPRLARLLADAGGGLTILEGRERIAFELPGIERVASDVPPRPPFARAARSAPPARRPPSAARPTIWCTPRTCPPRGASTCRSR